MIKQFLADTALLLVDVQKGVDVWQHWGGPNGRRNNPSAEPNMLKFSLPTGEQKPGFEPSAGEIVVEKDVNSGFVGTSLEVQLRHIKPHRH